MYDESEHTCFVSNLYGTWYQEPTVEMRKLRPRDVIDSSKVTRVTKNQLLVF